MQFRKNKGPKDAKKVVDKWMTRWKKNVALIVEEEIEKAFSMERHSNDRRGRWTRLKPTTQRQRASFGYNPTNPILFRSGRLKRAIKVLLTEDFVEIVTKNRYSQLLNDGWTGYKKGGLQKIAARRHLEIPDKFLNIERRKELTNFQHYVDKMNEELWKKVYKK